ncbi:hypothetical protein [Actinomycetospora termitidis]|uniref:Uncharacterized protein n=1 Tax=Actinomycetospora termitidis TaxID=3053470 RepID=A0ABT7MG39_9PSEU|nr:hypothetical protein [Actinomycetospora sp. Odt1-22]MDL5159416.1 hypothetical protein [Actinomycetospora sp. Odt1-22]
MSPDLSRRVGRALHAAQPTIEVRVAAQSWTSHAATLEELPGWLRREVARGERLLDRRKP